MDFVDLFLHLIDFQAFFPQSRQGDRSFTKS